MEKELASQFGPEDLQFLKNVAKDGVNLNAAVLSELLGALIELPRAPIPAIPLELALYKALG